jgi:hypothetical protein
MFERFVRFHRQQNVEQQQVAFFDFIGIVRDSGKDDIAGPVSCISLEIWKARVFD